MNAKKQNKINKMIVTGTTFIFDKDWGSIVMEVAVKCVGLRKV